VRCRTIVKLNEQGNKKTKWLAVLFGVQFLAEGYVVLLAHAAPALVGGETIPLAAFLCNDSLPLTFQRLDGTFLLLLDSHEPS
jgi:hypothetical protein